MANKNLPSFAWKKTLPILGAVLFLVSLSAFAWIHYQLKAQVAALPQSSLPIYSQLPSFTLTESSGRALSLSGLKGNLWIADFMFTSCPGPCPMMSARMSELQRSLSDLPRVRLVSISVDPANDTPTVLKKYGAQFHADPNRWFFLTGDQTLIAKLSCDGFKVGTRDDPLMHSTKFILVDAQGQIRGYYDSEELASLRQLQVDIRTLATTL
jgi:protein SCO1/2